MNIFNTAVSGPSTSAELDRLVNVIGLGMYLETKSNQRDFQRSIGRMHYKGGRYIPYFSAGHAHYETLIEHPELAASFMLDVYGKPIPHPWESTPERSSWCQSLNEPIWQAFLLEEGRSLVDAGVDGINIDEIEGNTIYIYNGGSFGSYDMSGFREYLAENYTPQELLDSYGIVDIDTFDYKVYIHNLGLADTWMSNPGAVPLFNDFYRYQRDSSFAFMTKFINETRKYAQTTYGRSVAFTGNPYALSSSSLIVADLLDYFTNEYPFKTFGYPPASQAIPNYKLARALGNKPAVMFPDVITIRDLANYDSLKTLMNIYIAEAYASRGALMIPYGDYWSYADMVPAYAFVHDNPFLYQELDSLSQVAVLYSFPSAFNTWEWDRPAFRGLSYALLDGKVQYDVVVMGDNVWLTDTFSPANLAPFRLVFLPNAAYLSNSQVDTLLSFVNEGGTLIAWGETGMYDETGNAAARPELAALTVPGTHPYGGGWFIMLTEDPGERYIGTHDATVRQQMVSLVNAYASPITMAAAERTLNLLAYGKMDGSQMIVHLINYDYTIETDQITPTEPFTMKVKPPVEFLDQDEIQVYLLSPDRTAPSLVDFTDENSSLVIKHPGVKIYDVLAAMTEADAQALAVETLDTLTQSISNAKADGYDTSLLDGLLSEIDTAEAARNHLLARQLGLEALDLLRSITRRQVLFDEAHDERNTLSWERALTIEPEHPDWVYFGKLAATLNDDIVFTRNPNSPLSLELLENYDALMLAAPREAMDAAELEAIKQYVAGGGGLVVLGDCGLNDPVNTLTSAYNITFDPHCILSRLDENINNVDINTFSDHPAVAGIPFMTTSWAESLTVGDLAVPLAWTRDDAWRDSNGNWQFDPGELTGPFIIAAAYEGARGHVVAVSDKSFHDAGFEWYSNDLFMRSLLRWVTGWHPIYENHIYLPLVLRK